MATLADSSGSIDFGWQIIFVNVLDNMTLTIPSFQYDGQSVKLKRIDNSEYTLTIVTEDSTPIENGLSSITLAAFSNIEIYSFNNQWYISGGYSKDR